MVEQVADAVVGQARVWRWVVSGVLAAAVSLGVLVAGSAPGAAAPAVRPAAVRVLWPASITTLKPNRLKVVNARSGSSARR
jgi:ABC-type transport system substrate-binding protein